MELVERCRRIKFLLLDVDGVLTDGRLYYGPNGEELKQFFVRDGYGLKLLHEAGFRSGIISGRQSPIVEFRARELGIEFVKQGREAKLEPFHEICDEARVSPDEIAFIGDDTLDIVLFDNVGLSIAVADAHPDVCEAAQYITKARGGLGAVREVVDMILASRNQG